MLMTAPDHGHEHQGGSVLTRKIGPLPMWAWMGLVLLVALVFSVWQHNKAPSSSTSSAGSSVPDQTPPQVFQIFDTDNVFTPGSGDRSPPPGPPSSGPPGGNVPPTPTPTPTPTTTPAPAPVPAPAGQWVTVSKFTSSNPPWNSTLWGIAAHLLGNGSSWGRIWNDPANANLRSRRGNDPKKIQPQDRIWVPAK